MQLSDRAKELIPKARIVSLANWQNNYPQDVVAIFQKADDEGRYLSDEDIGQIKILAPQTTRSLEIAQLLREQATEIISQARQQVLEKFPGISEPGGDLYPPLRGEACWRDFWHFLRCITYGIAGQQTHYTSREGLTNMQLLYQELRVPLKAMIVGLENLKRFSLQKFETKEQEELAPYFDHLITQMKSFLEA
jgi:allophycocyanin-B